MVVIIVKIHGRFYLITASPGRTENIHGKLHIIENVAYILRRNVVVCAFLRHTAAVGAHHKVNKSDDFYYCEKTDGNGNSHRVVGRIVLTAAVAAAAVSAVIAVSAASSAAVAAAIIAGRIILQFGG